MKNTTKTNEEIDKLYTDTYRTRMPLYNDYVFHRVFGSDSDESRAALIGLLNIILERGNDPIKHVVIKNPIDYNQLRKSRKTVMDIKAETDSREILDIEMQVEHLQYFRRRILHYGGRLVNSSLQYGEDYDKMKKSIVVSITKKKLLPKPIGFHSIFRVKEEKTGQWLSDRLEFHFLELGKVNPRKPVEDMTQMERLAVYLRYADNENYKEAVQKICRDEEGIVMAENLYRKVSQEEKDAAWAESRYFFQLDQNTMKSQARKKGEAIGRKKGEVIGLKKGEAIGIEKGEAIKQREIAKNMLQENMPKSVIAKITGLSLDEVEAL